MKHFCSTYVTCVGEGLDSIAMQHLINPPMVPMSPLPNPRSGPHFYTAYFQSWARNNTVATTRRFFQATKLFVIAILLYLVWLLHGDTETEIFFEFFLIPDS